MTRRGKTLAGLAVAVAVVTSCSSPPAEPAPTASASPESTILVAAANTPRGVLLANVYAGGLNTAGHPAEIRILGNRDSALDSVEKGTAQVFAGNAGALADALNRQVNGTGAADVSSADLDRTMVSLRSLAEREGLEALNPAEATEQHAFAVREAFAEQNGIATLSDLAEFSSQTPVRIGGPTGCARRKACLIGLKQVYGVVVAGFTPLDAAGPLTKAALKKGAVDVGVVNTADGSLEDFGLVILDDDRNWLDRQNVVPVVNRSAASVGVTQALNNVSSKLSADEFRDLDRSVAVSEQQPAAVADAWLTVNGIG